MRLTYFCELCGKAFTKETECAEHEKACRVQQNKLIDYADVLHGVVHRATDEGIVIYYESDRILDVTYSLKERRIYLLKTDRLSKTDKGEAEK